MALIRASCPLRTEGLPSYLIHVIFAMNGALFGSSWAITVDNSSTVFVMVGPDQIHLDTSINQNRCETISADMFRTSGLQNDILLRCIAHIPYREI